MAGGGRVGLSLSVFAVYLMAAETTPPFALILTSSTIGKIGLLKIGKPETKPFENGHFRAVCPILRVAGSAVARPLGAKPGSARAFGTYLYALSRWATS